jgi:hypothetical protein
MRYYNKNRHNNKNVIIISTYIIALDNSITFVKKYLYIIVIIASRIYLSLLVAYGCVLSHIFIASFDK